VQKEWSTARQFTSELERVLEEAAASQRDPVDDNIDPDIVL